MKSKLGLLLAISAVLCAGCSSSSADGTSTAARDSVPASSSDATHGSASTVPSKSASPPSTAAASDVTYANPTAARTDMCAFFTKFYGDLIQNGPRGNQAALIEDLGDVHHGIGQAALATNDDHLLNDVNDLVAYVGAGDFSTDGNVLGAPIQAMQTDCP